MKHAGKPTHLFQYVDPQNSTTTPLNDGESFTGEWTETLQYPSLLVAIAADQDCTYQVQYSINASDIDSTLTYNFVAGEIETPKRLTNARQWYRIVVTNSSGSNMTYLRLQATLGHQQQLTSPLNTNLTLDSDAIATRPSSIEDEIVLGRRSGVLYFTKFGYRTGLTAANGEETLWATTGNFTPMTTASTFTITYNSATDGLGTTGALTLYIQYVDANGEAAVATHTLSNTGSDVTSFTGLGINRIAVSSSGTAETNTNNITVTETTGGTTQAIIPATQGVTQQLIYHVAANARAIGKFLWINCNKLSGGGAPRVTIKAYVWNRNVETKFEVFRVLIDTNTDTIMSISEPVGFGLSPSDVLYFVADTDTNSTTVNCRFSLREYRNL